ncbi:MAG: 50S ribosomal protein L4 [Alphaproteobacteria bacterium]|nr:MAG: 50S ribosomal protein L4 [Alphaproteobacteria bacterium]
MSNPLVLNVVDIYGKNVGDVALDSKVFDCPMNDYISYEAIRWHRANARQGTHCAKGRSDVAGSTKKIRAQKETGKARQGNGKAPHFTGGGVYGGPIPRSYKFKLNKKVKALALRMFLSDKVREKEIVVIDDFTNYKGTKTREFVEFINNIGCNGEKKVLLLSNNFDQNMIAGSRKARNINLLLSAGLNSYSLYNHNLIALDLKTIKEIESRLM